MTNKIDDRIPTLEDCINNWKAKNTLHEIEMLETKRIQLEARVKCLQIAEESLLQSVIRLSRNLSHLSEEA